MYPKSSRAAGRGREWVPHGRRTCLFTESGDKYGGVGWYAENLSKLKGGKQGRKLKLTHRILIECKLVE